MAGEESVNEAQVKNDNYESGYRDLEWAMSLYRICLQFLGIWPEEKYDKINLLKHYLLIPLMIIAVFIFIFIPQLWALKLNNDLIVILDNIATSTPAFTCSMKFFLLWQNSMVLKPVVDTIMKDWMCPKNEWEYEIMRKEGGVARNFTIYRCTFVGLAYFTWVLGCLAGISPRVLSNITDYGERYLICQSYYPCDYSKSPYFELTQLSQILVGSFIIMGHAVPNNYLALLVYHLGAQFKILGISIENFVQNNGKARKGNNNKVIKNFTVYIKRHVHLMRMVSTVEQSFNLLFLVQLFCTYAVLCVITCRIVYVLKTSDDKEIYQIVNLVISLFGMGLITLTDFLASEALNSHSDVLFSHIYNCKRYMIPEENTHDLIFMMLMSKNPQVLTAGKIIPLSLTTYCSILKSVLGYISFLVTCTTG